MRLWALFVALAIAITVLVPTIANAGTGNCRPAWKCATTTTRAIATTTTAKKIVTTTTLAACLSGCSIWSAHMEGGNLNEWTANGGGNMENSGNASAVASQDVAHSGSWSLKATINGAAGVRAFRWDEGHKNRTQTDSIWVYVPQNFALTANYWNLFQWKSRTTSSDPLYPNRNDPVIAFYMEHDAAQNCWYARWGWGWGNTPLPGPYPGDAAGGKWIEPSTKVCIPIGRWFQLAGTITESSGNNFDGSFTWSVDGTQEYNVTGIRTSYNNCTYNSWCGVNEWSTNLYSDGLNPNPFTVYFDDADISTP